MARRSSGLIGLATPTEPPRLNGSSSIAAATNLSPALPPDSTRRPSTRSTAPIQKLDGLANANGIDPDELFSKHSISELKTIQQRLRADADAKQEELRIMVGERYRDLLQASTSILALAKSSKHVLEALEEMRDTVNAIVPVRTPKRAATGQDKHLQALQSLSAHVKLLLDAPEHLWRLMEKKAYLNAAWLFLLARVVHRALSQEDDDQSWQAYSIDVVEQMPLVQRQWDAITPFRSQISHRATLSLRELNSTPGEVCATLLTLHLLESRPLPETLSIYLAQRTKTLSSLLTRNASTSANCSATDTKPNGKIAYRPRKAIVRDIKQKAEAVLDAISRTVCTTRIMFANGSPDGPSLMKQALQFFQAPSDSQAGLPPELQLSTQILLTTLPSSSHLLLLPQTIRTYKPYTDGSSVTSPALQPQLRDKLEAWFKKAVQDAKGTLADWFAALDNVREVWDVRSSLLTWLKNTEGLESPERLDLESVINSACQRQATSVWKSALGLLEASFQDAVTSAQTSLEHSASEHPYDIQPVEHLFRAPPIPQTLQSGTQMSAAAAHFSKYKSSLRQQLTGRTPLLDSALATLERHASNIQKDVAVMLNSAEIGSDLVTQLSASYGNDAEALCENICVMLSSAATSEEASSRGAVLIARLCQELAHSSDFFTPIGCGTASIDIFRERLQKMHGTLMENWQKCTVSRVMETNFREQSLHGHLRHVPADDAASPNRPSYGLAQALLTLSSELQQLGVCLEEDRRRQQAGSTLRHFIASYLAQLDQETACDLQLLWDLAFLQKLHQLWGNDITQTSEKIAASITRRRDSSSNVKTLPLSDIAASAQEYFSRTQILLAGLLPSQPSPLVNPTAPTRPEKPSSLLLYGTPIVEQRFEPALKLVKTPPRFGLLLVGGATVR